MLIWGGIGIFGLADYYLYFGPSIGFLAIVLGIIGILMRHSVLCFVCAILAVVCSLAYCFGFIMLLVYLSRYGSAFAWPLSRAVIGAIGWAGAAYLALLCKRLYE